MGKAYIIANEKQELNVLKNFEQKGLVWMTGENPTNNIISEGVRFNYYPSFPYVLIEDEMISWLSMDQLKDEEIEYDGRKEGNMYKVTREFMNNLVGWRDNKSIDATSDKIFAYLDGKDLDDLPFVVDEWWRGDIAPIERNNRLIAILKWLNNEDVFEVEKPHKFMVRSERADGDGNYKYVKIFNHVALASYFDYATKFDTREEAQEWANSHQVVVEIDEYGNEVE